jgi:hypothetical protein
MTRHDAKSDSFCLNDACFGGEVGMGSGGTANVMFRTGLGLSKISVLAGGSCLTIIGEGAR